MSHEQVVTVVGQLVANSCAKSCGMAQRRADDRAWTSDFLRRPTLARLRVLVLAGRAQPVSTGGQASVAGFLAGHAPRWLFERVVREVDGDAFAMFAADEAMQGRMRLWNFRAHSVSERAAGACLPVWELNATRAPRQGSGWGVASENVEFGREHAVVHGIRRLERRVLLSEGCVPNPKYMLIHSLVSMR